MQFRDRVDAGRRLATLLEPLRTENPVVLALPRGGVPVAAQVAAHLGAPLDVILVRKLGVPAQPELAMGAIGEGDVRILSESVLRSAHIQPDDLDAVTRAERTELERRRQRYRAGAPAIDVTGRTVILVDDGLATGASARAAIAVARAHGARRVVLAVPVAPPESVEALRDVADDVVAVETPAHMWAIGSWYRDFRQTNDDEVVRLLAREQEGPERTTD